VVPFHAPNATVVDAGIKGFDFANGGAVGSGAGPVGDRTFSPNRDGVRDTLALRWTSTVALGSVTLNVLRLDGSSVGSVAVSAPGVGAHVWRWDGTVGGKRVPDGRYLLQLVGVAGATRYRAPSAMPATAAQIAGDGFDSAMERAVADLEGVDAAAAHEQQLVAQHVATGAQLAAEAEPAAPPAREAPPSAPAKPATETPKASSVEAPKQIVSPPPSSEAKSAEAPASIDAWRDSEGLNLTFTFPSATPAASFRRGDTVWLLFDSVAPLDVEPIRTKAGATIGEVTRQQLATGQAIRIRLNRPQMHSLTGDERTGGAKWNLIFADKVEAPPQPLPRYAPARRTRAVSSPDPECHHSPCDCAPAA